MVGKTAFAAIFMTALPSALAISFRHLIQESPPLACYIENGFDYVGNDIGNEKGRVDECCSKCYLKQGCTAWSWSNHEGGTCWLKSGRGEIKVDPNVKSALQKYAYGEPPYCVVADNIDYVGNDIGNQPMATVGGCCDACHKFPGCRAYSWSNLNGGTCWFKSKVTQTVYKAGVKSASAYPDVGNSCPVPANNVDLVGNDIDNKPSGTPEACCDICKAYNGCRAYAWTNQNGGTCWLKNYTGKSINKQGVVSATVYPNPQCNLENDTDYPGNDIANVPSKDPTQCCSLCHEYNGCKAVSWSDLNGGTCWLKSSKGTPVSKPGVKSTTI